MPIDKSGMANWACFLFIPLYANKVTSLVNSEQQIHNLPKPPRHGENPTFLTREQVAEELNISWPRAYALIRRDELRAAKIGGRGVWRIGRDDLEACSERTYTETVRWVQEHPFSDDEGADEPV